MDLNKILVPIDGSKKSFEALDRAVILAGFTHGHVTGIHVIPHVVDGGPRTKAFDKQLVDDAKIVLKKATKRVGNKNVKFTTKILRGSPGHVTLHTAKTGKFDHIVMSTTGSGSATEDMIGSVSNHILQKSKIPVYLIK
ncbi:MAG: universal stress protein [Nitrosopumilus sp.]|nr:universal stress protein [Nitrosopumilus sp.]MDH3515440.1 universal stress protein [Nitrosopumilus sp.]MDH3564259.1 universal stress protein [Nitrosopumilus sp.]MDH5416606.1 universal stress protein [Nitrosopumilus sp.]MDH5555127.1 universal stress protein [Nitrosopumilus sp.]